MKYCSNCGAKMEGNFCSNCGAKSVQENETQINQEVADYIKTKVEGKKNHNGYRLSVGIIMIVLGALVFIGGLNIEDALETFGIESSQVTMALTLPGLLCITGGILSITSKKNNTLLLASGIAYLVAAVLNIITISDISLLAILCCVFGPINIAFSTKNN